MNRSALFAAATAVATTTALGLTSASTATGAPTASPVPTPAAAVAKAKEAISSNLSALRAGTADAFVVKDVIVDKDGSSHVRMDLRSEASASSVATSSSTRPRTARSRAPA